MRFSILALLTLISGGLPAASKAASFAWEAMLPAQAEHRALVEFSGALEAKNGDLLVAGSDGYGEYMARLQPDGKLRWLSRSISASGSAGSYIGIHETHRGIVSLWGCCGDPGWTADLYGDTGGVAGRLDLGYPRGNLDVTQSARVVFLSNALGLGQTMISAEGRSLTGADAWKTPLVVARIDEVVGTHAVGDSSIAVLDRLGGQTGDTLMATLLDGTGKAVWLQQVPTGAKPDGYADYQSIIWSHISYDTSGRIVLAGLVENLPIDSPPPAAMAIAVFTTGGSLMWLKKFPLELTGDTHSIGARAILSLNARSEGIRVFIAHGSPDYWSIRDIPWSGNTDGIGMNTPPLDQPSGYLMCEPVPSGAFIGYGSTSASGGLKLPHDPRDSSWSVVGLGYPILFGPVSSAGKNWSSLRIPEYADTVWTHRVSNPENPTGFLQTEGPGLYFLLPTMDGGAVTGGRLWRRNGEDTLSVIAIKIPPEEINALPVRPAIPRARASERPGSIPFDATGRFRRKVRSPVFRFQP